ncbi:MAG TPA: HAMP domain-containing sensor histidine kinase [Crinalium sp.]|jgi:signal transduction histidine kinase
MPPIKPFLQAVNRIRCERLDSSSLQFRLTVGIAAFSIVGLGGVAVWTSWKMQQILVSTHLQNIEYIGDRFSNDVTLYSEMLPIATSVQKTIDNLSPPNSVLWVRDVHGEILAQSRRLDAASGNFATRLLAFSAMPQKPQIRHIDGRYLILASSPLMVKGQALGQLYIAHDITQEQVMLNGAIRGLTLVTVLIVVSLSVAIALYVRRSLQPLRQMCQLAGTISANDLSQAKIALDQAPSEVRKLAGTLENMLSRLSQSWEHQRQFVSNVSHELRTPLSVVYGYLQSLLRRGTTLTTCQREALEIATAETDRTIRLLQDLLNLARADGGHLHFHWEPIILNDLVEEIVHMGERFSDRTLKLEPASTAICIKTDRDRLTQVLLNLIDNAVKYSDPPEPIIVSLKQSQDYATIQVSDRGCGIPLQKQTLIFERFYRVDDDRSRVTGGTGLGLSIVKSLVEGMGGQVSLWSKPGEGSTFIVTLPMQPKD